MKIKQTFITNFPADLFGSSKLKKQEMILRRRQKILNSTLRGLAVLFERWISIEFLHSISLDSRKRAFPQVVVFWAWMAQILQFNASCSKAVSLVQSWRLEAGLGSISSSTAFFCAARSKLPLSFIKEVWSKVITSSKSEIRARHLWCGMEVFSVDGSSVQLMDTIANQNKYPQPAGQKKGCGFPVMKVLGILNHSSGLWEDYCVAHPNEHDAKTMSRHLTNMPTEGLLMADRAFCSYEIIHRLRQQGMESVMRLHQMRAKGFTLRLGKRIGKFERLVTWKKPKSKPAHCELSDEEWSTLDQEMEMRVIVCNYVDRNGECKRMILATTLLDNVKFDWLEIVNLYANRWDIEVRLRDVKTTMQMEELRVQTPEMAEKCLAMALLAYNLVRSVCQESANQVEVEPKLMSYKETLDWINSSSHQFSLVKANRGRYSSLRENFITIASSKQINYRPYRWEPRLLKKRPKPFGLLKHARKDYHAAHQLGDDKVGDYVWNEANENLLN